MSDRREEGVGGRDFSNLKTFQIDQRDLHIIKFGTGIGTRKEEGEDLGIHCVPGRL